MAKNFEIKTTFRAVDKTSKVLGKMRTRISRFVKRARRSIGKLNSATAKVSGALTSGLKMGATAAAGAIAGLTAGVAVLMKQFSKVEDAQAAFTPVLGGAEDARKMVDMLNKTAASTPFQFETLASATQQLLPNMNKDMELTVKTLRMLGDTAGGNAQKMDSIVRGYNKALLKGKVDMESLNMIAEAGVPIFGDLGKVIGKTGDSMFKAISAGEVKTDDLTKAFERMTGEGGMFYRGMDIASQTLSGRISTLKDNVSLAAAEVGGVLAPYLKEVVGYLTQVAGKVKSWIIANKELIASKLKGYIEWFIDNFPEIIGWLKKIGEAVAAVYAITTAIKLLNAVLMMNPIVLIVTVILAAIAALIIFREEIKEFLYKAYDWIVAKFEEIKGYFLEFWAFVRDTFWAGVDAVVGFFVEKWEWAKEMFMLVFDSVTDFFSSAMAGIMEFFQPVIDAFVAGWEYVGEVFHDVWQGIKDFGASVIDWIMEKVDLVVGGFNAIGDFFGFGDDEGGGAAGAGAGVGGGPSPVRPSVDISRTSEERFDRSEVTIKDETGRARQTKGKKGKGFKLVHSGAMP